MDEKIKAMYCLCNDRLQALHHREEAQRQITDAEVPTTALVAALGHTRTFGKIANRIPGPWLFV